MGDVGWVGNEIRTGAKSFILAAGQQTGAAQWEVKSMHVKVIRPVGVIALP